VDAFDHDRLSWRQRGNPALEEPSLVLGVSKGKSALVRLDRFCIPAEPP
jgi:hypothetical protein